MWWWFLFYFTMENLTVSYSKVTNIVKETLQAACEQWYHPAYMGELVPLFSSFEGGNSRHAWELQSWAFKLRNKRPRRQWKNLADIELKATCVHEEGSQSKMGRQWGQRAPAVSWEQSWCEGEPGVAGKEDITQIWRCNWRFESRLWCPSSSSGEEHENPNPTNTIPIVF